MWQAEERFNSRFRVAQVGPTKHGTQPLTRSFLEVKPGGLHVSAVKQSESGKGWVVRLFNPSCRTVRGGLRLNGGRTGPRRTQSLLERVRAEHALPKGRGRKWRTVREVTLEECPVKNLAISEDGWVKCRIGSKSILTVEFLP